MQSIAPQATNVGNTEPADLSHGMNTESSEGTGAGDSRRTVIAIDLTPLLPGAENGGAKLIALDLTRRLGKQRKDCDLVLLTSSRNHEELASLEDDNVRRFRVNVHAPGAESMLRKTMTLAARKAVLLAARLPPILRGAAREILLVAQQIAGRRRKTRGILEEIGADVFLCPFTAVFFYAPTVPIVSILYDLQHLSYPEFFEPGDLVERTRNATDACRLASRVVCISDYVRSTVIERLAVDPRRLVTIHPAYAHQLPAASPETTREALVRLHLEEERFLLYPANFWAHKNHRILLTALAIHRTRHPDSRLKLVCTGSPGPAMRQLIDASEAMGLGEVVVFPGFLAEDEFAALLRSSFALLFPSLYEGFGMPVLEAMSAGKPILCSNVTSLPEVVGDAALRFDPRIPSEIAAAIRRLEEDAKLVDTLVQAGFHRLRAFRDPEDTAARYGALLDEVRSDACVLSEGIHGLYADGWTSDQVRVIWGPGAPRSLEVTLRAPSWLPRCVVRTRALGTRYRIAGGKTATLRYPLGRNGGVLDLLVAPATRPCTYGVGDDDRLLGCECLSARILEGETPIDLLQSPSNPQ